MVLQSMKDTKHLKDYGVNVVCKTPESIWRKFSWVRITLFVSAASPWIKTLLFPNRFCLVCSDVSRRAWSTIWVRRNLDYWTIWRTPDPWHSCPTASGSDAASLAACRNRACRGLIHSSPQKPDHHFTNCHFDNIQSFRLLWKLF